MTQIGLLFPHQLFSEHSIFNAVDIIYLIEEHLFFNQYAFHKQKIAFHRASMKSFVVTTQFPSEKIEYIDSQSEFSDIKKLVEQIATEHANPHIHFIDPTDYWLLNRLSSKCDSLSIETTCYESPLFLNSRSDLQSFFKPEKTNFFQTSFYKKQRKKLNVLLDNNNEPIGGKWTFDSENRKKYPKEKTPPYLQFPEESEIWNEAVQYTTRNFPNNPGQLSDQRIYPINHDESNKWLEQFLNYRFHDFGDYEDAIVKDEVFLNHSVLSPMLNTGLILPQTILNKAIAFADDHSVPINSIEGFVRQIIGWREFVRGMYAVKGVETRTKNFWNFNSKIPKSFYTGTTGIDPVDSTIKKVLKTGYCHHIERLMILGNFMLLCEFDPDEVYRWFMELFIDAYDWVMVPNVYGMSQFADGGLFATKPYISSSNYVRKMSDHSAGDWQPTWDGLFWRFMHTHRNFFKTNPRSSMLINTFDKMSAEKQNNHLDKAEAFLSNL